MILSELITRVADDGNVNSSITSVYNRLVREVNRVCQEIWEGRAWSFRWRNYRIVTDVDYTTGTVTATNASRTITGSGTAFSSSHVGWHIQFPADSVGNWYKVRAYTSATQLELDVAFQGTTGSSKSYILRHFDYVLPTEPWDFGSLVVTADNRPVTILDPMSLDIVGPVPLTSGYPSAVSIYGSDSVPTTYTTGTLSGTINTNTLTGVGTSWLANVYPGDLITIGSYAYTIRSVDSDTGITLYNYQQVTSTTATYTITRQFGRIMRILWPSTYNYTLDIRALRKYAPLVNTSDTNEILYRFPNALILKTAALELKQQNDNRSQLLEKDAEIALLRARGDDDALTTKVAVNPIYTYRTAGQERFLS